MAALRHLNVRGMKVEVFETSFKIEGMWSTIHVGPHVTNAQVKDIICTIYDGIRDRAEANAKHRITNRVMAFIEDAVLK